MSVFPWYIYKGPSPLVDDEAYLIEEVLQDLDNSPCLLPLQHYHKL